MSKKVAILVLLAAIIALPILSRREAQTLEANPNADTLVIISPHARSVLDEFYQGFEHWYQVKTGRAVEIDRRYVGGL
ncbi:MAG TPA: iron ABC transporter substrate-binding protein, partial [Opitutales bacterium]|nr:iron ABC transporter substrate-binding protein [Opitutales bacterium]